MLAKFSIGVLLCHLSWLPFVYAPVSQLLEPLPDMEDTHGVDIFTLLPEHCFEGLKHDATNANKFDKTTIHDVKLKKMSSDCKDVIPQTECQKLFQSDHATKKGTHKATAPTGGATDEHFIDPFCVNPNFANEAMWCADTCKMCCLRPEYNCADRPGSVSNLCEKFATDKTKCGKDPDWENCRQTCGMCNQSSCEDRHIACDYLKGLCFEPEHKSRVQRLCPLSCDKEAKRHGKEANACTKYEELVKFRSTRVRPADNCEDTAANCQTNIMLCEDEVFMEKMSKGCRNTCGYCVKHDFQCEDKDTAKCEKWHRNGFCDVEGDYPKGVMLQYCPKKCDLCDNGSNSFGSNTPMQSNTTSGTNGSSNTRTP